MVPTTKQKILDVSINLFSEKGYTETSIRDIAKAVNIKTSSIYYHFESKEAILHDILNIYLEVVNYDKHYKKWQAEKNSILSGTMQVTADRLLNYMFFFFDEDTAERNIKIAKIICNEASKNDVVRSYQKQVIKSGYNYIKDVLDILSVSEKIKKHNTSALATALYSIAFAYMHLETIDMHSINEETDENMFSPLKYVLKMALEENFA